VCACYVSVWVRKRESVLGEGFLHKGGMRFQRLESQTHQRNKPTPCPPHKGAYMGDRKRVHAGGAGTSMPPWIGNGLLARPTPPGLRKRCSVTAS
jgi:hypothetical protein